METKIYNQLGQESGKILLPEKIFGLSWNADLVHQVVTSMRTNMRHNVAHAKDRGEVRGGGKKPWQQKGTGRARHGSIRSPLWVGGGVTHGPTNKKNFQRKVNKKMKIKALNTVLSKKIQDGEVLFFDKLEILKPKTKSAKSIIGNIGKIKGFEKMPTKKANALYIGTSKKDRSVEKSFNNFSNIKVDEARNISPIDALQYRFILLENPQKIIGNWSK